MLLRVAAGLAERASLARDDQFQAGEVVVSRNYIHHNRRKDFGLGVSVGGGAYATIDGNVFDFNRHAVSSSGRPYSGYVARYNYNLQSIASLWYYAHYDVHGCDANHDYNGGDAGEYFSLYYNTIRGDQSLGIGSWDPARRKAFHIRGVPRDFASFIENVVVHDNFGDAIDYFEDVPNPSQHLALNPNYYDTDHSLEISGKANFDGDVYDDLFLATGSPGTSRAEASRPGSCSRFRPRWSRIWVSAISTETDTATCSRAAMGNGALLRSGAHVETDLARSTAAVSRLRFGDFDGNGRTDVFRADGSFWWVSWDGRSAWEEINSSSNTDLRFGDFDRDRRTDVFAVRDGEWSYSSAGRSRWIKLSNALAPVNELVIGKFTGSSTTSPTDRHRMAGHEGWHAAVAIPAPKKRRPERRHQRHGSGKVLRSRVYDHRDLPSLPEHTDHGRHHPGPAAGELELRHVQRHVEPNHKFVSHSHSNIVRAHSRRFRSVRRVQE